MEIVDYIKFLKKRTNDLNDETIGKYIRINEAFASLHELT